MAAGAVPVIVLTGRRFVKVACDPGGRLEL
jgi:hypothetical protein